MIPIDRLQSYLRESARQRYEAAAVPPFTLFFHPTDPFPYFNYAIPDEPVGGDLGTPLAALRAVFTGRGRQPRFEFIADFAPRLAPALQAAGFIEESAAILMTCTPETYRPAPESPGLTVTVLDATASLADVQATMAVQHEGFSLTPREAVGEAEAAEFLRGLAGATFFLARLEGEPVSAGSLIAPLDGLAEVAGIATRPAFRRRGIAAVITDYALRTAFACGVEVALLTAGDAQAGRVYERVGFRAVGMALAYG